MAMERDNRHVTIELERYAAALSRLKHGFESRWGHQSLNSRNLQHSHQRRQRPLARKANHARSVLRLRREREAPNEELPQKLTRRLHVLGREPTPVLERLVDALA